MPAPDERAPRAMVTRQQHALGLLLILLVAVIWVSSAELIQFIFGQSKYDKPVFLTYLCTSLFSLFLFGFFISSSWRALINAPQSLAEYEELAEMELASGSEEHGSRDTSTFNDRGNDSSTSASLSSIPSALNVKQVFEIACFLAPLFFVSQVAFNLGLAWTSVSSSSTISTMSCLFTLAMGAAIGVERFSWAKLVASILTILGVATISGQDNNSQGKESALGDVISVVSAFLYGMYATYLKKRVPSEEMASMAMILGFLGIVTAITCWPILIVLHWLKWEEFDLPSTRVVGLLILNALIGTVLSEYLWARSVALTTPVIATLALSLTVPLSLVYDCLFRSLTLTTPYIVGVCLVVAGFFIANADEALIRNEFNT